MNRKNTLKRLEKFELAYLRANDKISRIHNDIIGRKKELKLVVEHRKNIHETILLLKSKLENEEERE